MQWRLSKKQLITLFDWPTLEPIVTGRSRICTLSVSLRDGLVASPIGRWEWDARNWVLSIDETGRLRCDAEKMARNGRRATAVDWFVECEAENVRTVTNSSSRHPPIRSAPSVLCTHAGRMPNAHVILICERKQISLLQLTHHSI